MLEPKSFTRMMTLACAAVTVAACGSATAPDAANDFRLDVQNRINQMGPDSAAAETTFALFYVYAPAGTSLDDLSKISAMKVVWPDSVLVTPVGAVFTRTDTGYTATASLPHDGGLLPGTYTLEVDFADGQRVRKQTQYDGHTIGRPVVQSVLPSPGGVALTWLAPPLPHTYRLLLDHNSNVIGSSAPAETPGGETLTASVSRGLTAGASYVLTLLLWDSDNQRAVYIPFGYGAP